MFGFGSAAWRRVARITILLLLAAGVVAAGAFFVVWWRFMRGEQEEARVIAWMNAHATFKTAATGIDFDPGSPEKLEQDGFKEIASPPGLRVFALAEGHGTAGPRFVTIVRIKATDRGSAWDAYLFDRTWRVGWRMGPDTVPGRAPVSYDRRNELCGADAVLQEYLAKAKPLP